MDAATPPANVYEGNGQLSLAAPIPGAHPDHVRVVVSPSRIRVAARCKYPQESQHFHRREWQVGAWELDVDLPALVDPGAARATLSLGVLTVMAPLSESDTGADTEVPVTAAD